MDKGINKFDYSGIIIGGKKTDEGTILLVEQNVRGRKPSRLAFLITSSIVGENGLGVSNGDMIIIQNAVVYQEADGSLNFRVCDSRQQIIKVSKSDDDYNLGEEDAKEKFI